MKLIEPSVEIWQQGDTIEDMWKHIARCTLVCRQAETIKDGETAKEFCMRTILGKEPLNNPGNHLAMLEHGTVYLTLDTSEIPWDKLVRYHDDKHSVIHAHEGFCYATTNLRVLVENNWLEDLKYISKPTEYHEKRVTVSFITNIGVSREFNRHRVNSMVEESTRYCNYSKDKFDNQITFVKPAWIEEETIEKYAKWVNPNNFSDKLIQYYTNDVRDFEIYSNCLQYCQSAYILLIERGWTPQQAREVLPLATKTQLIHTAFISDWKHFIDLRFKGISGAPHPNAKIIAEQLYNKLKDYGIE